MLGSALFAEGFEVQDAPLYGAERRGAPMLAYVRASHARIDERGVVREPDLVAVADPSLFDLPAGVLSGVRNETVLFAVTDRTADELKSRLAFSGRLVALSPPAEAGHELAGTLCAAAAARLLGIVSRSALERAINSELSSLGAERVARSRAFAVATYEALAEHGGSVREGGDVAFEPNRRPEWIELGGEPVLLSAPAIHAIQTSRLNPTGAWRVARPVIDYSECHRCHWICSSACPDAAIVLGDDGAPLVDLEHCKGCLICAVECPWHAIQIEPERRGHGAEESSA